MHVLFLSAFIGLKTNFHSDSVILGTAIATIGSALKLLLWQICTAYVGIGLKVGCVDLVLFVCEMLEWVD